MHLLQEMARQPQEYVTPQGRVTTNSIKGFHSLALKYRGKRIDLQDKHGYLPQGKKTAYMYHCDANNNVEPWSTVESSLFVEYGYRCPSICCKSYSEGACKMATATGEAAYA